MAKCSADTALRDIQGLIDQGILIREEGGGRSVNYALGNTNPLFTAFLRRIGDDIYRKMGIPPIYP